MSQKVDSKVSAVKKDVITVILTAKSYHEWVEDAELVMGSKYGRIADVLRTRIPYVEPRPTAAQYHLPVSVRTYGFSTISGNEGKAEGESPR